MRPLSEAPRDGTPIFLLTYQHGTLIGWYRNPPHSDFQWAYIYSFIDFSTKDYQDEDINFIRVDYISTSAVRGWLPLDFPPTPIR